MMRNQHLMIDKFIISALHYIHIIPKVEKKINDKYVACIEGDEEEKKLNSLSAYH